MLKLLKDRSSKQHDWRVTAANNRNCFSKYLCDSHLLSLTIRDMCAVCASTVER